MNAAKNKNGRVEESARLIAIEELSEAPLVEMAQYWETKRAGRKTPLRSDMNPADFVRLMPRIFMLRVGPDPLTFTYSLIGDDNVQAHGRNFTGWNVRDLDNIWPGYGTSMHDFYALILRRAKPQAACGEMSFVDRGFCRFEAVYLPLAVADGTIGHIMGAAVYKFEKNTV
ncbi:MULTISPECIES: PAS domain-containing protein [Pseudomonadota]|uniref:PAS domain-containing protein n=1 Tax=Pseudomonadota TaxID=1224 RepID=UPI00271E41AC|nr:MULTISPECIES: PAS domain-containing protein [Pseudomonadota]MDO9125333.1 PAS domain-containing protein [Parvibaculum sp.]MDP1627638.1 PAS domain-containing protein [Parvibaculum sp.]MDP2243740.1 PAS domain-containing protein [Pseudomonas sp.]MDP3327949.1 PAS domain-containing protein [Parvibaculum sp.]